MKDEAPIGDNPGDEKAFRVAYLVAGFLRHTLTASEQTELDDWVTANMDNQRLFERLIDQKTREDWQATESQTDTALALKNIKQKKAGVHSIWVYAAAACVLVLMMIGYIRLSKNKTSKQPDMVQTKAADIPPGRDRATLTLADGRVLTLDSIQTGSLDKQGNGNITKTDSGQLAYKQLHPTMSPQPEVYNTLSTPSGGQFKVVLPDGTKVWLNASSSIRYPVVFGGARRTVELTGEAYFEVAKDPMFPFEVKAGGSSVQVLGTHFNINAYKDEPLLKVVLAEGSVKLNTAVVLKPGEQGTVSKNGNIQTGKADLEAALAWKNGQFIFKELPMDELMRQVARWYNAEIIYNVAVKQHFNASMPRDTPVSKLLHLLEGTGEVHFSIEDNKIIVMK